VVWIELEFQILYRLDDPQKLLFYPESQTTRYLLVALRFVLLLLAVFALFYMGAALWRRRNGSRRAELGSGENSPAAQERQTGQNY
jgi:hypothetical protein